MFEFPFRKAVILTHDQHREEYPHRSPAEYWKPRRVVYIQDRLV